MAWIPSCPEELPGGLQNKLLNLAAGWARSRQRPRVLPAVLDAWDELIEAWLSDHALPIYLRRARDPRGKRVSLPGGRSVVAVDNSPPQWAYALALNRICPTLEEISTLQERDQVPVAMVFKKSEKETATYKCPGGRDTLNSSGWKLCHIEPVGLGRRGETVELPLNEIEDHFRRLMSPRNMFVVPKNRSGLGELPEMLEAVRRENERPKKMSGKVLRVSDLLPLTFGAGIGGYSGPSFNVRLERFSEKERRFREKERRFRLESEGRYAEALRESLDKWKSIEETGTADPPTCFFQDTFLQWGEAGHSFEEKDRKKITPSPEDWLRFWEELEEAGVWSWEESYQSRAPICDGASWGVEIKKPGRRKIDSGGSNEYPDEGFGEFLGAVSGLLGGLEFS